MSRRIFLRSRLGMAAAAPLARAAQQAAPRTTVPIQQSPLTGFQYHAGETVWNSLREGDALAREPQNLYDARVVSPAEKHAPTRGGHDTGVLRTVNMRQPRP